MSGRRVWAESPAARRFLVALALALNILYFFGLFIWVGWLFLASTLLLARPAGKRRLGDRPAVEELSPPPAMHPAG